MADMQGFMKQAKDLQEKLMNTQEKIANTRFEGVSGGGLVKAVFLGNGKCVSLTIDPTIVTLDNKDTLEDLIIAAINNAYDKIENTRNDAASNLLPPGFKLPF
jgi:nucleoid-associated protein EbfC